MSSRPTAVDVHGFGGGFTLGAVQAGWDLKAKMSRAVGFGVLNTLANRNLLGEDWDSFTGPTTDGWPAQEWPVYDNIDMVFGNPPCSGFSTLSRKDFRGNDSKINECMWELVRYAGLVAPQIVVWESVQQTFRQGLGLMRDLHAELEKMTGETYTLTHVLHNNASHGGVSIRKRYFWVASRVPFGVDHGMITRRGKHIELPELPMFGDMLQDLEPLGLGMLPQPYRGVRCSCTDEFRHEAHPNCPCSEKKHVAVVANSSDWCRNEIHDGTGMVDGHDISRSPTFDRSMQVLEKVDWLEGENISAVLRKYYEQEGSLPRGWQYLSKVHGISKADRLVQTDFAMGHNQLTRWYWDKMARVITGGAVHLVLHPHLPRTLTQREAARIQGFPDDWHIWPVRNAPDLGPGWGKGVPVQAGRWVAYWARKAVEGRPGPLTGVPLIDYNRKLHQTHGDGPPGETVVDTTKDYLEKAKAQV